MAEGLAHRAEGTGHSVKGGKKEVEKVRWWEGGKGLKSEVGMRKSELKGMGQWVWGITQGAK